MRKTQKKRSFTRSLTGGFADDGGGGAAAAAVGRLPARLREFALLEQLEARLLEVALPLLRRRRGGGLAGRSGGGLLLQREQGVEIIDLRQT